MSDGSSKGLIMPYKFEREELLQLLIRAYDEGNYGFLDLAESVAEKLVEESENKYEEKSVDILPSHTFTINNVLNNAFNPTPSTLQPSTLQPSTLSPFMFMTHNFSDIPIQVDTINIESDPIQESNDII